MASITQEVAYVYRDGVEIGRAGIPNAQVVSPLQDHIFSVLQRTDKQGHLR